MAVLARRARHAKADMAEEDKDANHQGVQDAIDGPLRVSGQRPGEVVEEEAECQDGEVECWVLRKERQFMDLRRLGLRLMMIKREELLVGGTHVVMNISDAGHDDERQIVQHPADDRVETGIVDLVNVALRQIIVASLPSDEIPGEDCGEDSETRGGSPVDDGIS